MFTDYSFRAHFVFSRQGQSVRMGALGSILVSTNSPAAAASILKPMSSATPTLEPTTSSGQVVLAAKDVNVYYGSFKAVQEVNLECFKGQITALIGPSGCGKTTLLRCFNRMNDLIASARVEGSITYHGIDMYGPEADAGEVRRRIGMVFQKPNPFPKSIFDNVAYGPRVNGEKNKKKLEEIVEKSLRGAALWDEVKDRLDASGLSLSGGQQQRLCIARTIAVEPEVVLMDEPCSALDPIATARIEDLMQEIKSQFTIVIVTHNMQQAARVSDRTAFFTTEINPESDRRTGRLVEVNLTRKIFSNPSDPRTEAYVSGKFG
jgi:phosphate transport system ATP-binding protein